MPCDGEMYFYKSLFDNPNKDYFSTLVQDTDWKQEIITIFGKQIPSPRLTDYQGIKNYQYSGVNHFAKPYHFLIKEILDEVEKITASKFNSALLNYYRNGNDSMGWHQDNESVLGKNPTIVSVNFGQGRHFQWKHKFKKELQGEILLQNGDLLVMKGEMQHFWLHQVPKRKRANEGRINITFRKII